MNNNLLKNKTTNSIIHFFLFLWNTAIPFHLSGLPYQQMSRVQVQQALHLNTCIPRCFRRTNSLKKRNKRYLWSFCHLHYKTFCVSFVDLFLKKSLLPRTLSFLTSWFPKPLYPSQRNIFLKFKYGITKKKCKKTRDNLSLLSTI